MTEAEIGCLLLYQTIQCDSYSAMAAVANKLVDLVCPREECRLNVGVTPASGSPSSQRNPLFLCYCRKGYLRVEDLLQTAYSEQKWKLLSAAFHNSPALLWQMVDADLRPCIPPLLEAQYLLKFFAPGARSHQGAEYLWQAFGDRRTVLINFFVHPDQWISTLVTNNVQVQSADALIIQKRLDAALRLKLASKKSWQELCQKHDCTMEDQLQYLFDEFNDWMNEEVISEIITLAVFHGFDELMERLYKHLVPTSSVLPENVGRSLLTKFPPSSNLLQRMIKPSLISGGDGFVRMVNTMPEEILEELIYLTNSDTDVEVLIDTAAAHASVETMRTLLDLLPDRRMFQRPDVLRHALRAASVDVVRLLLTEVIGEEPLPWNPIDFLCDTTFARDAHTVARVMECAGLLVRPEYLHVETLLYSALLLNNVGMLKFLVPRHDCKHLLEVNQGIGWRLVGGTPLAVALSPENSYVEKEVVLLLVECTPQTSLSVPNQAGDSVFHIMLRDVDSLPVVTALIARMTPQDAVRLDRQRPYMPLARVVSDSQRLDLQPQENRDAFYQVLRDLIHLGGLRPLLHADRAGVTGFHLVCTMMEEDITVDILEYIYEQWPDVEFIDPQQLLLWRREPMPSPKVWSSLLKWRVLTWPQFEMICEGYEDVRTQVQERMVWMRPPKSAAS